MRFWDTSALVPLLASEATSERMSALYTADPGIIAWWATRVECTAALARREREGAEPEAIARALVRLAALTDQWQEIEPGDGLRATAARLLRTHPLRSADALQLAAAIAAADGEPSTLPFVTLDERLAIAAGKEGFPVVVPGD